MARPFDVRLHAVNLVTHPHSREGYEMLIRSIFRSRQPIHLRGDRYSLLTSLSWLSKDGKKRIARGTISTFTHIDMDAPWLNSVTGAAAENNDTEDISIPKKLHPNLAQFSFWFDLEKHLFIVQGSSRMLKKNGEYKSYSFGPTQIEKYLQTLCELEAVNSGFDRIDVTVIPDSKSVSKILNSTNLRSITITIKPPNTDSLTGLRSTIMNRLNDMGAKTKVESYTALPSTPLKPDDDLRSLARVAATNGRVDARIGSDEGVIPASTVGKPLIQKYEVDTDIQTEQNAFEGEARLLAERIYADNQL